MGFPGDRVCLEGTEIWTGPYGVEVNLAGGARSWMAIRVRPREWNIFLRCQCPPAKDHHEQTYSWASWVYDSLKWGVIYTILYLSKKESETTIILGFGFWLDDLGDSPWKWGFALDWKLSGSEDHSCYINKFNQDRGDTRVRLRL